MSTSQKAFETNAHFGNSTTKWPPLILEKQLTDTNELCWHVRQARNRSNSVNQVKTCALFDGMISELQIVREAIQKRLGSWNMERLDFVGMSHSPHWRLFDVENSSIHEVLEALLCGYAHYARQTSQALKSLELSGDLDSAEVFVEVPAMLYLLRLVRLIALGLWHCRYNRT